MNKGSKFIVVAFLGGMACVGLLLSLNQDSKASSDHALVLYCAAGVKPAIVPLVEAYEREYGQEVQLMYGGSGTLLSNIQVASRGDLYIAADQSYLDIAASKGLILDTLPLAWQRPVIAVAGGNPKRIESLEDLKRSDIRIALGNPEVASIGKQTRKLLEATGLWEVVKGQVEQRGVFKPTVPEVANGVKLGAVDAGIIWDATLAQYPGLEAVRVRQFDAARKQVSVGVLRSSQHPSAAFRFARYLNSEVGNSVFAKVGFEPVEGDRWEVDPEVTFFCGAVGGRSVDEAVNAFERREGVTVHRVYGGCSLLTEQMRMIKQGDGDVGFPDVYMASDRFYLESVGEWFQREVDVSEFDMVIAVWKGNPKDVRGIQDLSKEGMRVSVGHLEKCVIGLSTAIMLRETGDYDDVMNRVVMQTATSALLVPSLTGKSVDASICYMTDALAESDQVDFIRIGSSFARSIQPFSIARSSEHQFLARRLCRAVAAAEKNFEGAGFGFLEGGSLVE